MRRIPRLWHACVFCLGFASIVGCGSSSSPPASGTGGTGAPGSGGVSGGTGGATHGTGGATSGTGGATSGTDAATSGTDAAADANASDSGGSGAGSTTLSGTLAGALGAVKPIVSTLWISNSGETLVYLSSAALTCDQLMVSRWLGAATAGSQVVEIVIKGAPKVADYPVPPGEVNCAAGGKSSAYETVATAGKVHFTSADAQVLEGSVMATYGANSISGTFHATFCANGQGY